MVERNVSGPIAPPGRVVLRDVHEADLELFFGYQLDPEATAMADFPARDRDAFMALWGRILANETIVKRTVLFEDQVAGNIFSFVEDDGRREVGYWLGRDYWGKGIATRALIAFLAIVTERPLYAEVAIHNHASRRVLQKCGFHITEETSSAYLLELPVHVDHMKPM
jgi:RimJ/RimL family protein N-acetyltransferase